MFVSKKMSATTILLVVLFCFSSPVWAEMDSVRWEDLPEHLAQESIQLLELNVSDCPKDIENLEPSRVVAQVIENTFYLWEEYEILTNDGIETLCIVMKKPNRGPLSKKESQVLLTASSRWTESKPRPEDAIILDASNPGLNLQPVERLLNDKDEPFQPENVIGPDDRERITDTTTYPWNTHCYLELYFPFGGYQGTGCLVSPYMVLTCGHNVYNQDYYAYVDSVTIAPGQTQYYEGGSVTRPYGTREGVEFQTNSSYIGGGSFEHDYGAVFFDTSFSGINTFMPVQFSSSSPSEGDTVCVAGYPGVAQGESTSALWTDCDPVHTYTTSTILRYTVDTSAGQSGSPVRWKRWVTDPGIIVAVHAFGNSTANGGPRLRLNNKTLIEEWMEWTPPRSCEDCEPEDAYLGTIGTVVWGYSVSGNCGNGGKWVGQFVGEAGATYHFDLCPDSPGSGTNSGFDPDIKITNNSCTILDGEDGSCSSPSYSPNDYQWICTSNGTYYVIIAPYSSYNSHTCGGDSSDTFTLKYYKEQPCSITVTSPPGGGWWELDDVLPIIWDSEYTSGDVKIELYKGGSLEHVIGETWSDTSSYDWSIPTDGSLTGDNDYQIKVTDVLTPSCYDYSNYFGIATPPEAQDDTVTTSVDTPVTIILQAADEGQPDPPAALTYTIMSLPIYGELNDPCAGPITDPCTPLVGYGTEVEYVPGIGYEGQDSFTFIADDGGEPPGGGDSNEATVSVNVTACIFFDDFPSTTLDTTNWTETSGTPTVDDTAVNEPSAPYSLHLEAADNVTSRVVDLYECWSAQLHYWWKRVDTESGDDLYVDYWDGNEWKTLQVLPGGANTGWEPNSMELPVGALHSEFRLRFWADCDSGSDEWYIDDACIQCRYCADPPVLYDEPNKTQGCCNTIYWEQVDEANEYYAECSSDPCFSIVDSNSGWITDTSYEFCGLTLGQTYWYHVLAWVPFLPKIWLQTTQADFETDTLTDTIATTDGNVVIAGGGSTIFQDDFEDGNYDGWIHGSSSCTREVVDNTAAAGTTYSFTQIGSSDHRQGVYYTLPSITPGRLIFHVRTDSTEASAYVVLDAASSSECAVFFYSGYGQLRVYQDKAYGTSRELLTWYKVEFVFHWLTKTFDFYVDDALVADSIPFRSSTASYINTIHLYNLRNAQAWWDEMEFSTGSGGGYTPIGDIVSTAIDLPVDGNWGVVDFNTTTPADTDLTVDVLPAAGSTPIPGYENVSSGADLSGISEPTIRLRANLSTTDANNTPVLHNWSVGYTDPAFACESDWSNMESSLQCATPGDFEPDCDVDMADLAVLVDQWLRSPGAPSADIAPPPDGDGTVNFLDFAEFATHWLQGTK
jgi:V8-like Glu-specific endopeptidase